MREIGADVAAGRIDDYLARRIDTAAAEDRFDARGFDEIFRGRVTQDTERVANINGARDMAALVGRGIAHVPHNRAALERLGDESGIDDPRRPGGNERQAKDAE